MEREILEYLKMNDVKYEENRKISDLSKIHIGEEASLIIYPSSAEQLVDLLKFLKKIKKQYKIIGRMSNVLFPDEKFERIIIKTDLINSFQIKDKIISIECGCSLYKAAFACANLGFSAFEELSGIPGSIGGALFGNAGAFGRDISDVVCDISCYDYDEDEVFTEKAEHFDFSYRESLFKKKHFTILSGRFKLFDSNPKDVKAKMHDLKKKRVQTQPVDYPSLGSSFKRPGEHLFAAKMIDECGLRGYRIGGAMISEKHAGFIVNFSNSTAKDYIDLLNYARECVLEKFGIYLEEEVEILKA